MTRPPVRPLPCPAEARPELLLPSLPTRQSAGEPRADADSGA